jgi:arylsulfatase A
MPPASSCLAECRTKHRFVAKANRTHVAAAVLFVVCPGAIPYSNRHPIVDQAIETIDTGISSHNLSHPRRTTAVTTYHCPNDPHIPMKLSVRLLHRFTAYLLLLLPATLLLCVVNIGECDEKKSPPNIVMILADDLGYGDVQCNNPKRGKIPTPHINRLAAQGMRFTDGHSSSGVCSPSRYALLTGRYHWRSRLQQGIVGVWGEPLIAADRLTIAGLAKQHGYRTACVGKWHLGRDWPMTPEQMKQFSGFGGKAGGGGKVASHATDVHRETWKAVFSQRIPGGPTERGFDEYFGTDVPNWPPYCFIEGDRTVGIPSELLPTEKLARGQASLQGPAMIDWQLEPILPALGDRACRFIAESAAKQTPFLLYLPLTTPHTPLAVNAEWKGKSGLENACADLIMETDAVVGQVLAALEKSGQSENTLVLFSSDNGFAAYSGAQELEQRGHYPSGPLRGYKSEVFEGGHRVPFIVRWPAVVKAGGVCDQLVHHADLIATLAEILGSNLPENAGEDSFSFLSLLQGNERPTREHAVSCAASGVPGFRHGSWKLILAADPKAQTDVQLYHLADDLGETKNLAAEQPERVAAMNAQFEKIITNGRSTPGALQENDVPVRRYPVSSKPTAGKKSVSRKT